MAARTDPGGVIVECASCGQKNRLAFGKLDQPARCGKCKTPVGPLKTPVEVGSPALFDALAAASPLPVVVDFWAPWCGPCRIVAPELEKVAASQSGTVVVAKVNTEAVPELADRFGIRSIPTLAVFRNGREVTRAAGARPAAEIERLVARALGAPV